VSAVRSLSLVIPARDEEATIEAVVRAAGSTLQASGIPFEVIVVDDGSTDGTGALLDALDAELAWLVVVHERIGRGKGAAVRAGFARARMAWLGFIDADLEIPVAALGALIEAAPGGGMVTGYRTGRRLGPGRRAVSIVHGALVRALLGVRVRDANCPMKLLDRSIIADTELVADGWVLDAELLALATRRGEMVVEIAVPWNERAGGASKVRPMALVRAVGELVRVRRAVRALPGPPARS
jgi:glycosyltransferase involved in cell wall biosynthesis